MSDYYSFLICQHPDKADIYFNGLPVGYVRHGEVHAFWHVHEFTLPDGAKKPLTFKDLLAPKPFKDVAALKAHLHDLIDLIEL